jgi:outer membrane murein-binding lipoprotein Lpp
MERTVRKEFILAVGICLIAVLIAGCEEQNLSTAKESKLIAYENRQLKEQLAQQEKKIEEQGRLLEECQQRREVLEESFEDELNVRVGELLEVFAQLDKQLNEENNELKAQVKELQAQVSKLEQELKRLKPPAEPQPLTP